MIDDGSSRPPASVAAFQTVALSETLLIAVGSQARSASRKLPAPNGLPFGVVSNFRHWHGGLAPPPHQRSPYQSQFATAQSGNASPDGIKVL